MAEKKFAGISGTLESAELSADYADAKVFDKVRAGRLGVYYRDGLRLRYIAYAQMERVFIRIQEVTGRMCCGSTVFAYFRLVFVVNGREYAEVISESESAMDGALAYIHEQAPEIPTGVAEKL